MRRLLFSTFLLLGLAVGCGGRSLPGGDGQVQPDHAPPLDLGIKLDGEPLFCSQGSGTCLPTQYCATVMGDCQGLGVCTSRPLTCPQPCPGVCGCDGVTYCSECEAHAQGVSVRHLRACEAVEKRCSLNGDCVAGEYCHVDDCNDDPRIVGRCRPRPQDCPAVVDPVCGCSGITYANECEAHRERDNVAHIGQCEICATFAQEYEAELQFAKQCCPFCNSIQCTQTVPNRLLCGCPTSVDQANSAHLATMEELEASWKAYGCAYSPPCPPVACQELTGAGCTADSTGSGRCEDVLR